MLRVCFYGALQVAFQGRLGRCQDNLLNLLHHLLHHLLSHNHRLLDLDYLDDLLLDHYLNRYFLHNLFLNLHHLL